MERGSGSGRGQRNRQGRMFGRKSAGPGGHCVCPKCDFRLEHQAGQPCYERKCPKCGTQLIRE